MMVHICIYEPKDSYEVVRMHTYVIFNVATKLKKRFKICIQIRLSN